MEDLTNNNRIGIELTEYFDDRNKNGSKQRELDEHINRIQSKVQSYLYQNHPDLNLYFHMEYRYPINIKINTDEDFELIILGITELMNPKRIRNSVNLNKNYLGKLYCRKWNGKSIFQTSSTREYKNLEEDRIREYVQIKTLKQKKWRDKFQLKWLVIHTGFSNCNTFDLKNLNCKIFGYKENWDKIIVFDPWGKKLINLL